MIVKNNFNLQEDEQRLNKFIRDFEKIKDFEKRIFFWNTYRASKITSREIILYLNDTDFITYYPTDESSREDVKVFWKYRLNRFYGPNYFNFEECYASFKNKLSNLPLNNKRDLLNNWAENNELSFTKSYNAEQRYINLNPKRLIDKGIRAAINQNPIHLSYSFEYDGLKVSSYKTEAKVEYQITGYIYKLKCYVFEQLREELGIQPRVKEEPIKEKTTGEMVGGGKWTNQQTAILFEYILRAMGTEMNAVKVSEFIHGFTGRSAQSIRTRIGAKKEKTYTDDLVFVRNECEKIGLLEVVKLLNKDIEISK